MTAIVSNTLKVIHAFKLHLRQLPYCRQIHLVCNASVYELWIEMAPDLSILPDVAVFAKQ